MVDTYADFYSDPFLDDKAFKKLGCFVKVLAAFWAVFYASLLVALISGIILAWKHFG